MLYIYDWDVLLCTTIVVKEKFPEIINNSPLTEYTYVCFKKERTKQ